MKVNELTEIFSNAIEQLKQLPQDAEVKMRPNSYNMDLPLFECYDGYLSLSDDCNIEIIEN